AGAAVAFAGVGLHTASGVFHGFGLGWDDPSNYQNAITGPISGAMGGGVGQLVGRSLIRGRVLFSRTLQSQMENQRSTLAASAGAGIDIARGAFDIMAPQNKQCPQG
ncbi:MAG: hypothetical protein ACQRW7_01520, partial [Caulobacterales bacterium]|uniref:hypothetical protein n=1 Tax=Glycocaulis sp. TaxID=1969725 RepID=UPI003FA03C6D